MKKTALLLTLALVAGLFATQALAWRGGAGGCGGYGQYGGGQYRAGQVAPPQLTPEQSAAYEKFLADTSELRAKMFADRAEMRALMRAQNPDASKIRALAENVAKTRQEIAAKAKEAGIPVGAFPGRGVCGLGNGRGQHRGYGSCWQ